MRLLLDTHIWIWSLQDPKRLGRRLLRELHNPENELWLSPISTWEALMLHEKGRLRLHADLDGWVIRATAPFQEAPLTHEIAAASRRLNLPQRDPADRFLAATALVLDLVLVTADASLLGLGEIATLGNR
jgi:PIN domain nuclease of toxin-antitoxin system